MKTKLYSMLIVSVLAGSGIGYGQATTAFSPELLAIHSRIQSMSHGYFSRQEWNDILHELDELALKAERQRDVSELIEINLLQAIIYGDVQQDYGRAATLLEAVKEKYGNTTEPAMRRVYGRLAECYGRLGREPEVAALIEEFKTRPFYDAESYSYSGGLGREVPLSITRPGTVGGDSITVTAMEKYKTMAEYGPGSWMPDLNGSFLDGSAFSLAALRGSVVLVDFWVSGSEPWRRELPNLRRLASTYGPDGFTVVGICLDLEPSALSAFARENGLHWPQVANGRRLAQPLGIFGECASVLLDRNGVVVGRNLKGADLTEAVKRSL